MNNKPYSQIPAIAFGPLGRPPACEIRFWRLIEERNREVDGTEVITLACGHRFTMRYMPETQEYAFCAECLRTFPKPVSSSQPSLFETKPEAF